RVGEKPEKVGKPESISGDRKKKVKKLDGKVPKNPVVTKIDRTKTVVKSTVLTDDVLTKPENNINTQNKVEIPVINVPKIPATVYKTLTQDEHVNKSDRYNRVKTAEIRKKVNARPISDFIEPSRRVELVDFSNFKKNKKKPGFSGQTGLTGQAGLSRPAGKLATKIDNLMMRINAPFKGKGRSTGRNRSITRKGHGQSSKFLSRIELIDLSGSSRRNQVFDRVKSAGIVKKLNNFLHNK
ncbi:hypothetical protein ACFL35_18070, partial [Candidatus Riflebacteria bacterium]